MEVREDLQRKSFIPFLVHNPTAIRIIRCTFTVATILALSIVISPMVVTAQGFQEPERHLIADISVEGNQTADAAAIISNSGLRIGDVVTIPGESIAQAIRQLHALRLFRNISIEIESKTEEGVHLLIRVSEYPRLERVEFVGNDKMRERNLRKLVTLSRGQIVKPEELTKIQQKLTREYAEKGRILADIEYELLDAPEAGENRVILRFTIEEGKDIRVRGITFVGNDYASDRRLRRQVGLGQKRWWRFWSRGRFDQEKYDEGIEKLVYFYRKEGFRDVHVERDSFSFKNGDMFIEVQVHEGPRVYVRDIEWVGNTVYSDEQLNLRLRFQRGDVYNMERFERNLFFDPNQNDVASLYLDNGYLAFNAQPREIRVAKDSVDLKIRIQENNQFRIGQVLIQGNTKTRENVIRRLLYTRPGDYYSRQNIIRSIRELQQLDYFNPETMEPQQYIVDEETVNILFDLEEKSSDTFNASVGYAQGWGFTGGLGLSFNNFDLRRPFTGGGGQQLVFDWQFGEAGTYRTFSIGFTEPWLYNTPTLLGINLYDTRYMWMYDLRQTGGSLRIGRRLTWPDDYFRGDWIIRGQRVDVIEGGRFFPEGISTQFSIAQIIRRNSIDNPIFPTFGSDVSLTTELAGGPFLPGTVEFHRYTFEMSWYTPVFNSPRFALALKTKTAVMFPMGEDRQIPPLERFFMGGTGIGQFNVTPLRGYEEGRVGPLDDQTLQQIGGNIMAVHTLEFRFAPTLHPIPVFLLAFAEAGNVWTDWRNTDLSDLKRSVGVGIRLLIQPIGMIGFDYAYGIDDVFPRDGNPDGWRFHFQFGRGLF